MKRLIHSFTVRKVMELLLTLLIVTFLSFLLVKLSPVDAAEAYARRTFMLYTPEQLDALREKMGLNQPLLVQYGTWIRNALHLDFGTSLVNGRSVFGEVSRAMGVTLSIVLIAAAIEVVGILLVGSLCYWCRRKWIHLLLVFVCIVGVSIPPFFLASSFLDVFAVRFGWISVASSTGLMRYLPAAICLALGGIALYSQLLSQNIEREMNEDYAMYARCRGLSDMRILWTHALPHALAGLAPSFLQMVGISLAGSAIVEKIFSLPGLGYSIVDSVLYRDTPMIHATVTITYPHPYYAYAYDFCWPDVGGMQSPNQIVEGDFQTVQGYAGTGPYIYDEYVPGEYTRFIRNENYWGEAPYFDEIIARYIPDSTSRLQALQTGEIDLVYGSSMISYQDYQQATALNGIAGLIAEKDTRARDITLNASSGPLVDAKVRQAVSYAINKQEFSDGLTYGYERIAEMPFPEGTPYTDIELAETFSYDPEKAATLLDEAGWVMNEKTGIREKNGEALNLTYIYDTAQDALASSYATLLKSQLEKVGIGLELKGSEKMEWYAGIMAGSFDITYWIGEYEFSSPHCFFGAMASMTPHTFSLSQVNGSQEFFDAISTVKQTADPTEVQNLYNYLINYDLGNVIDIPLTYYKDMILYNTNKIAGYEFSGVPTFFDVKGLQPVA